MDRTRSLRRRISGPVVLCLLLSMLAWAGPGASPASAGTMATVVLSSTINVSDGDSLRDTLYIWTGPSNVPVIKLNGTRHATLEHLYITMGSGYSATAAIEVTGSATNNHLADLHVGVFGLPANVGYGIRINGPAQFNSITNAYIIGVSNAAVSIDNTSAVGNSLRGLYTYDVPIAYRSQSAGTTTCTMCGFLKTTDVDVELLNGSGFLIRGLYSELARKFARVYDGGLAGGLSVEGGYWQWDSSYAVGATIESHNQCCRTFLRLTDFMVTPLDGTNHGSTSGFTTAQKLFSNVAGLV